MFSPEDLAALVAVADSGSVRGAAAVVRRTQPAVTQAIKRLEQAVGFALLDRSGYRARLTDRGEVFAKRARLSLQQARSLESLATLLARGVEPRLRIVCHGALDHELWLHLTADLAQRFPDTVLELEIAEGDRPIRILLRNEAHLGLALQGSPELGSPVLDGARVGEVEFVTVVRAERIAELKAGALPQILVADFEDARAAYGVVEGQRHWRVASHALKAALILQGSGWGSVPRSLVDKALRKRTLRTVFHLGLKERSRHPFSLYRRRDLPQGPAATHVWNSVTDAANTISG